MSDFDNCLNWVLQFEDRGLTGKVVTLKDGAGLTRFGIAQNKHSNVPAEFYTWPASQALAFARGFYYSEYWMHLHASVFETDELAATLLSFAVNDGVHKAVKLLQGVLGFAGAAVDGAVGPKTLAAMESISDEGAAAAGLRSAQEAFYRSLGGQYLSGWLKRAETIYPALPS